MATSGRGREPKPAPTTPGRPFPDLTIYSVLDDGPDDTDPTPFSKPDPQDALTARRCVLCGTDLDHRECVSQDTLYQWLCQHMPAEQARHIVAAVMRNAR